MSEFNDEMLLALNRFQIENEDLQAENAKLEEALRIGWGDEREGIAKWMIANNLATGHGDTVDDLLAEAAGQIAEMRARVAKLEEALIHARGVIEAIMSDGNCDCRKDFAIIDAALMDAPSGARGQASRPR